MSFYIFDNADKSIKNNMKDNNSNYHKNNDNNNNCNNNNNNINNNNNNNNNNDTIFPQIQEQAADRRKWESIRRAQIDKASDQV